jgi:uncharacterized protein YjbJ (UPF0337 family)
MTEPRAENGVATSTWERPSDLEDAQYLRGPRDQLEPMRIRARLSRPTPSTTKGAIMGDGKGDDLKGRVKEAAGDLYDDDELKREGKIDRATGTVKDKVGDVSDKLKDAAGKH